ncbi:MAG: circularly permuted type 2 ATP-grasp protein [Gammaproteobacteria bacterium]|nr:circularly permuted type 2 ATP-grasp protein [Gammaproteobacteria bacterium]
MRFSGYQNNIAFDELLARGGRARPHTGKLLQYLRRMPREEVLERKRAADLTIRALGISFTVYSEGENIDRDWPYDVIPRVIRASEWRRIEQGLVQRLTALNMFINDVYNDQRIFKDKVIPAELLAKSKNYRKQCEGVKPMYGVWAHICGSDLIRDKDGTVYVLEDNLRVPSGVSYMLENRRLTKRVFPELFDNFNILPVDDYSNNLFNTLASLSPRPSRYPEIVVLTPGIYNSAYFEHAFLAQRLGAELVEGSDLVVGDDDCVYMKTIEGLSRVDVIYRRVDDLFLDPETFEKDSVLGCIGLMRAWLAGNVALANAPGAGVADDKVVYTYVPQMIKYYLGEDAILANVPSYACWDKLERDHVLANLDKLVVKPANESGGYGMLVGNQASSKEREEFARRIKADPRNYIAQPIITLSTVPTVCGREIQPRHVDLRPFSLQGQSNYVTAGGLTRVALPKGSIVVNSSQGGGSKDTWVVED